ncbi:MAG TPA: T9SS type A sorting domain-containing protein, partial [Saprospiraceae bacterium]|nr:T9SS type A sorting domain-containing protein [Saprospiraceae bacterium]
YYQFSGLNVFDFKAVSADNAENPINGVSTLDLVKIQRHILGIESLDSPYKLIAADINNSKSITSSDLTNLRKLILGVTDKFDNNNSWRFVPESYVFADPQFPFDFEDKVLVDSIYEDKNNVNFIAVKIGDINNSAEVNSQSSKTETRGSNALFVVDDKTFEPGKLLKVDIKAGDLMEIMGTQFTMKFDAEKLEFSNLRSGLVTVKSSNVNFNQVSEGIIPLSIDIAEGLRLNPNDILFSIDFRTKSNGNTRNIGILQSGLSPEVYDMQSNVRRLDLQVRNGETNTPQNILYQNQPNPFKDYTSVSFELSKAGIGVLNIMDITGKVVYQVQDNFVKGYNTVHIQNNQLNGAGIYYYQIETGDFSATRKMILIE